MRDCTSISTQSQRGAPTPSLHLTHSLPNSQACPVIPLSPPPSPCPRVVHLQCFSSSLSASLPSLSFPNYFFQYFCIPHLLPSPHQCSVFTVSSLLFSTYSLSFIHWVTCLVLSIHHEPLSGFFTSLFVLYFPTLSWS